MIYVEAHGITYYITKRVISGQIKKVDDVKRETKDSLNRYLFKRTKSF